MVYQPTGRPPGRPRKESPMNEPNAATPAPTVPAPDLSPPVVLEPASAAPAVENAPAELAAAAQIELLKAEIAALKARQGSELVPAFSTGTEVFAGMVPKLDSKGEPTDSEEEAWWYRIDLPPSGGMDVRINGHPFYHGETYKVRTNTLRTLKDIVARSWWHEASIKGQANDNAYRQPIEKRIGSRA